MKSKLHRATVTGADLDCEASIAVDEALIEAAGFLAGEALQVWNLRNGQRLGNLCHSRSPRFRRGSPQRRCARLVQPGDLVIVVAFCWLEPAEVKNHASKEVFVDEKNRCVKTSTQKVFQPVFSAEFLGLETLRCLAYKS